MGIGEAVLVAVPQQLIPGVGSREQTHAEPKVTESGDSQLLARLPANFALGVIEERVMNLIGRKRNPVCGKVAMASGCEGCTVVANSDIRDDSALDALNKSVPVNGIKRCLFRILGEDIWHMNRVQVNLVDAHPLPTPQRCLHNIHFALPPRSRRKFCSYYCSVTLVTWTDVFSKALLRSSPTHSQHNQRRRRVPLCSVKEAWRWVFINKIRHSTGISAPVDGPGRNTRESECTNA
mmetsp:Transcript_2433/g.5048  ORF Transcript_2433/g.5048 Transcript_2433/m.5048 type:complete len:236 (+) Transcript_2433:474-1181(+)